METLKPYIQLSDFRTTLGSRSNIVTRIEPIERVQQMKYGYDVWRSLSRHKLTVMKRHMANLAERLIWVDLDSLIFEDMTPAYNSAFSWAVGRTPKVPSLQEMYKVRYRKDMDLKCFVNGDIFSITEGGFTEFLDYEKAHPNPKPEYDIQGYISLLLAQPGGSQHFRILQEVMPGFAWGFGCSDQIHPYETNKAFVPQINLESEYNILTTTSQFSGNLTKGKKYNYRMYCYGKCGSKEGSCNKHIYAPVAQMAFTSPTFFPFLNNLTRIATNHHTAAYFVQYFYCGEASFLERASSVRRSL